jgi:autotransporter-associated beta strand protein
MKRNNPHPDSAPGQAAHCGSRSYQSLTLLLAAILCLLAAPVARAATITWTGASGTDTNWSDTANWDIGVPGSADDVVLSTNETVADTSINNVVDTGFITSVNSLTYSPTSAVGLPAYQNTLISDGQTLSISSSAAANAVFVGCGFDSSGLDTLATISGPNANFLVTASNDIFNVRQGGLSHFSGTAFLDLSGVSNATITVHNLLIGGDGSNALDSNGGRLADRPSGTLKLAQNSTVNVLGTTISGNPGITAGYTVGNSGQVPCVLELGATNYIYCDSGLAVGLERTIGQVTFNSSFNSPYAYFRGMSETNAQSSWLIGDDSQGGIWGGTTAGTVDFTGVNGIVDALVSQLVVGRSVNAANANSANATTGTLSFDGGTLNVNTAVIGYQMQDYCASAQGTVNVNGTAQMIVNTSMQLGRFMGANESTNGHSSAILNINGGSVSVYGNITTATSSLNPANDSEINLNSGSLYVKGTVGPLAQYTLGAGTTNTFDLGTSPDPATPICIVTNLTTSPAVNLILLGAALANGTIHVIQYQTWSGSFSDFAGVPPARYQGYFTNNTVNLSIDFVITNTVADVWNGRTNNVNIGNWDINITPDWKNGALAHTYVDGDIVILDDTAAGTTTMSLAATVSPASIYANTTNKNYTLGGSGQLNGSASLTKNGSGMLTIGNTAANAFAGNVTINGGTLQISGSADRLPTNAAVTLANTAGATLDLNGQNQTIGSLTGGGTIGGEVKLGSGTLTVRGTSSTTYSGLLSGNGRLMKTNTGTLMLAGANTYSGGTVISNGNIYLVNTAGSALGSGYVEIDGTGQLYIGNNNASGLLAASSITNNTALYGGSAGLYLNRSDNFTLTNYLTGTGQLYKENANTVTIATANSYQGYTTISAGALCIANASALGTPNLDGKAWDTVISGGSSTSAQLQLSNNITVAENLLIASKAGASPYYPIIHNISGSNTLTGTITWTTGGTYYYMKSEAGSTLVFGNPSLVAYSGVTSSGIYWELGGDGNGQVYCPIQNGYQSRTTLTNSLLKDGNGTWTLWATNTYIGSTTVSNGTLVVNGVVSGGGALGNSPSGYVFTDCHVLSAGTLRGNGLIYQAVTNYGMLAPGTVSSIGTLAISNYLTTAAGSTNVFRVSQTGTVTNDQVVGITTVTEGGDLKVLLTGTLVGGEVFRLFSANTYAGSFATFELPTIPPPLSWDTTHLAVDGTLRVSGKLPNQQMELESATLSAAAGNNFQLSGSSILTNWTYRVLATTNLATALSNWTQVGSGSFAGGVFSFTDLTSTNFPQRYYRVVAP